MNLFFTCFSVDKCFVPSDALYQCAIARKVQPSQIVQYGLPIRRGFWGESASSSSAAATKSVTDNKTANNNPFAQLASTLFAPKSTTVGSATSTKTSAKKSNTDALRQELGLEPSIPTVLVVGGGDGMGGITQVASALGKKLASDAAAAGDEEGNVYQMVVVCGNNQAAQNELSKSAWGKGVNVQVKGFVNNMDEWMRASDALVTKAGPGTIAEASICGLPCMLSSFL